ncbi:hypothetical protein Pfo_025996 [Paulownia fortunei]|nr:hypothetical protein Pfo_025996 [Paulownia fortunei]
MMVPEMEKPRVTEIKVRMDCNGCVQKIKKALHGITGIYNIYIDFSQQKIMIIGWADPEKIIKAIKKTRKSAIICSHTEQSDQPAQPTEPTPEGVTPDGGPPPPESINPPSEPTQIEPTPPAEAPKEQPQPENPPPESANATTSQSTQPSKPKDLEEIHVMYQHPPEYGYQYAYSPNLQQGYGGQWNAYHAGPGFRGESSQPPQTLYVTHSYNTYKPSPYVTEYAYPRSPPRYPHYSRPDQYSQDYYSGNNGNGNITSIFSEENPNACRIV